MTNNYSKLKTTKVLIFIISTIMIILIGLLKYYFISDMAFTLFFLIPIMIVAWHISRPVAWLFICIFSIISWFMAEALESEYSAEWLIYWNTTTMFIFFMIIAVLLGNLKILLQRERVTARTDTLTGVSNSKSFYEMTKSVINNCRREKTSFSIAFIDLDDFKKVNDTHGHITGDLLLQKVAYTFKKNIRDSDIVARLGGDEFVVLFTDLGHGHSKLPIERIRDELLTVMAENEWPVTFSIGVVTYNNPPQTVEQMIQEADKAMYCVKSARKNGIKHIIR